MSRVDRAAAELESGKADEAGDAERGERVGLRKSPATQREADQHQRGGDEIRREMQRIGGQSVAAGFARDAREGTPPHEIDGDRNEDRREGVDICFDPGRRGKKPQGGLINDCEREGEQKTGLRERGHRLDLGVAERVLVVGGAVGLAHRVIGGGAHRDVDGVVRALGDERERADCQSRRQLGDRQRRAGPDRGERRAALAARVRVRPAHREGWPEGRPTRYNAASSRVKTRGVKERAPACVISTP